MSLLAGSLVGPYKVVAALGAGAMGEVYRALDTRLQREIALKVLPDAFAKDANTKIPPDGVVKVLDFGLARIADPSETVPSATLSATVTLAPLGSSGGSYTPVGCTRLGALIGTARYMSPEQARGDKLDKRTDVWSFGVVVYEMLTGRVPFEGKSL